MLQQILTWHNGFVQTPLFVTLLFLLVAIFLFVRNKIRMDVVALLVMLAFCLSGILTIEEVFAGFSDPNVILIALLFIVGEGLVRTGIAYQVSEWLMRVANNSETKVLVLLMLAVTGLGAFMSSTGVVAIFIPVVLTICRQMNISPRRLMMPLSIAGLISGMMTLIATPPNLIVNAELMRYTDERLSFFSFTPIGLIILLIGILYMLFMRGWLSDPTEQNPEQTQRHSITDLIDKYQLEGRLKYFVVRSGSPFIGKRLDELHLRSQYNLDVVSIERWRRFRPISISALGTSELREKDILLIDIGNPDLNLEQFCQQYQLGLAQVTEQYFSRQAKTIGMAELTPSPEANILGKSVRDIRLRSNYGLNLIGIKRNNELLTEDISSEPFKMGDLLLVIGEWRLIQAMQKENKDFFVLSYPTEAEQASPASSQAPHALFAIATMVILMVTGIVPNVIAALIACLMLAKFRCVDAKSAYNSIHWASLILIVGMIPFSVALQKTGGVDLIVQGMLELVGNWDYHAILISLFVLCATVGLFISNTATAVLMAPIAITMAEQLNVSPVPFAMIVAIAASAAFMTPISSPVNTMVLGPGGYKFMDFVKVGVPFTILVMLVSVFLVPVLFPL
ncbi:SLC13 family permease [Volucribacter amazonae]|uniref:Citrate transporter n=1 Tax=Volucribacter amazonae TaxID=256731 RepID=A0A9X4SKA1_9PAST|nr:SLC13 family permease [Volucribacter amazonae]MDG6894929.1 citrate transporter [Volucribacter amazonae]